MGASPIVSTPKNPGVAWVFVISGAVDKWVVRGSRARSVRRGATCSTKRLPTAHALAGVYRHLGDTPDAVPSAIAASTFILSWQSPGALLCLSRQMAVLVGPAGSGQSRTPGLAGA